MTEITLENLKELQSQGKTLVVDYKANWCQPCKILTPKLEAIEKDYPNVNFVAIDIDKCRNEVMELGIRSIPTVIFYKGSDIVERTHGVNDQHVYKRILDTING
jgi:thioredoxin 1